MSDNSERSQAPLSSNGLAALADLFQYWLDWNQEQREKDGLESNDDCHVIQVPPNWPTRGNLRAWITALRSSHETTAVRKMVVNSMEQIEERDFEYPVDVEPSFALRNHGHGIAFDRLALDTLVTAGLDASPTREVILTFRPAEKASEHRHADECWEPDSGCDMGRNAGHVEVSGESGARAAPRVKP